MTMRICPGCGFENPERIRFCGQCATLLMNLCPSCGFENPPEFKFCGECATSLSRDSYVAVTPSEVEITPTLQPSPSLRISKEGPEEVALGVAKEWTRSSIDSISGLLGLAVTEGTPVLQNVASSLIGNQIKQRVEWTYSDPEDLVGDSYRVIATGSAPLEVGLLALKWRSTASANFEILIDTAEKRVLKWKIVPKSLKVISPGGADNLRERVGEGVEKVKGKLQGFLSGEGWS